MNRTFAIAFAALMLLPAVAPGVTAGGPPLVPPLPEPAQGALNTTYENLTQFYHEHLGITPVVFHEDFEGPRDLEGRGWSEEPIRGGSAWAIRAANATARDRGEPTVLVASGEASATFSRPDGTYAPNRESRLVSPPIDLRYALGASQETSTTGQPQLYDLMLQANALASARANSISLSQQNGVPAAVNNLLLRDSQDRGLIEGREGAGLVNLTFWHVWDLAPKDHAWVEVRVKEPTGWGPWEALDGDLVFETEVDYATVFQTSAYCDAHRTGRGTVITAIGALGDYCTSRFDAGRDGADAAGFPFDPTNIFIPRNQDGRIGPGMWGFADYDDIFPASLSQVLEMTLNGVTPTTVYYNSERAGAAGQEDTRTWAGASKSADGGSLAFRKSHFTLNRFLGEEIQIGFRFFAGAAAQAQRGWYLDEVEVTAAMPSHDPAANVPHLPEPGDVLGAGSRVRPVVAVVNHGREAARDLNLSLRVVSLDGKAVYLEETVPIPRLGPVESRHVGSGKLTPPLPAGGYRVEANITMPAVAAGLPQVNADRRNDGVSWAFAVRNVNDLRVSISVPPEAAMTELDEPKQGIRVNVTNRGNVNVTGTLNVTVDRVGSDGGVVGRPTVIALETLPASDLPYGKDLTALGSEHNTATRLVSWTGTAPGIYRIQARFESAAGVVEAFPQDVFVRMTPDAILGPLLFPAATVASDLRDNDPRQVGFTDWGYWAENKEVNVCGYKESVTTPSGTATKPPPLCPLPWTIGNLGAADGTFAWVATHDDDIVGTPVSSDHSTNVIDEGILDRVMDLGPSDVPSKGARLWVSFRHYGEFKWGDDELGAAVPDAFRGQFRILLDDGQAANDLPQRVEGAPGQDRVVYRTNFTRAASWDRVLLDVTSILDHVPVGASSAKFRFQWVSQSTPANVVPDWRTGNFDQDADGSRANNQPRECFMTTLADNGLCTALDPVKRWAIDEINVFTAGKEVVDTPPAPALFYDDAETAKSHDLFTGCRENLAPNGGRHLDEGANATNPRPSSNVGESFCRGWERYRSHARPTLWYTERADGRGPPSNAPTDESRWLRWGNPQGTAADLHLDRAEREEGFYTSVRSPSFSLRGSQSPSLQFDHWFEFSRNAWTRPDGGLTRDFALEGGNVWITGFDASGAVVLHEILFPDKASPSQYVGPIYNQTFQDQAGANHAGLRGTAEWEANYTKLPPTTAAAFARLSGGGEKGKWERATFDLTRYAQDEFAGLTFAVEFHAFRARLGGTSPEPSNGWRIDNVRVAEGRLANDVAAAEIESPPSLLGPGAPQTVVLRVRNDGVFAQRGVGVEYRILKDGELQGDVVVGRLPYGSDADAVPGLRDAAKPDKNVTFPFNVTWTPQTEGTYVVEARVNLSDATVPYLDENPLNDVVRKTVIVKEAHGVGIHGPRVHPDALAIQPAIGPVGEPRTLKFVVENTGTVTERFLGADEASFRLDVQIVDEAGSPVLPRPLSQTLREVRPGEEIEIAFPNAWVPTRSGSYVIVADLHYPNPSDRTVDDPSDNRRILKHLVFDVIVPARGDNLTTAFTPDDPEAWGQNGSRYGGAAGWSFPPGLEYPASTDASLVLDDVLNLQSVRSAFLRLNHSFDLERGYDAARVELSLDGGRSWAPVPPVCTEGWEALTSASPYVTRPADVQEGFTGTGSGVCEFNLAALEGLRTTAFLVEDDFEDRGLRQLRANLTKGPGGPLSLPTDAGFSATFEPDLAGRKPYELAVRVEKASAIPVRRVEVSLDSNPWRPMEREGTTDVWRLVLPTDLKTGANMAELIDGATMANVTAYSTNGRPLLRDGSLFRLRAFPDVSLVAGADPSWSKLPFYSGVFEAHPGVGARALDAPREDRLQAAPGTKILWSDKSAVLCWASGLPTAAPAVAGYARTNCMGRLADDAVYKAVGPILSQKYLQTTVDLREAPVGGSLKVELRDWAGLPSVTTPLSGQYYQFNQDRPNVRARFFADLGGADPVDIRRFANDPDDRANDDLSWNWTDRFVVVQGADYERLRGRVVTVRLEHLVVAAKADTDPLLLDGGRASVNPRDTDEISPHFGWGVQRAAVLLGQQPLRTLDPSLMTGAADLAAAGWTQGAATQYYDQFLSQLGAFDYADLRDVFALTDEPFRNGLWHQASAFEYDRPVSAGTVYGGTGKVNRFWEANSSRAEFETQGGASRLVMPLDLRPAVGETTLTFNTQYHFSDAAILGGLLLGGASGGRVEVSLDDGLTWLNLTPRNPLGPGFVAYAHEWQNTTSGAGEIIRQESFRERPLFFSPNHDMGRQSRFAEDTRVSVGAPSEYGAPPRVEEGFSTYGNYTWAFVGATPGARLDANERYTNCPPGVTNCMAEHRIRRWVPVAFDLTPYTGKHVLLAFHADFATRRVANNVDGYYGATNSYSSFARLHDWWRIDDLRVQAQVFDGRDAMLRLRAASDGTVSGSGWDVRELEVLSQKHLANLGVRLVSPTPSDLLRLGENQLVVEVVNKGVQPLTGVRVNVWVNATGPGAPPARNWTGPLGSFLACPGHIVSSEGSMAPESSAQLCGTAAGPLSIPAAAGVTYRVEVLADHARFASEQLVADNRIVATLTGKNVVSQDHLAVDDLVVRPSVLRPQKGESSTVDVDVRLVGFGRADLAAATLRILGDPGNPIELDLGDARDLDTRFTTPGEVRRLAWDVPARVLDTLSPGLYRVNVTLSTAAASGTVLRHAEAPLYVAQSLAASAGFLFDENAEGASVTRIIEPGSQSETKSDHFHRNREQCPEHPRTQPHMWCSYAHNWAGETEADTAPSPSMMSEPPTWTVGAVLPNVDTRDQPAAARARGDVVRLPSHLNDKMTAPTAGGQSAQSFSKPLAVSLESPTIDVRQMRGLDGASRVGLSFLARHDFGPGVHAKVYATPWLWEDPARGVRGKAFNLNQTEGGSPWIQVLRLDGTTPGFGEYEFTTSSADLSGAFEAAYGKPYVPEFIKLRFVVYAPVGGSWGGWMLDDIVVSPFFSTIGPAQAFPLDDDTDKRYKFLLSNGGAFSDRYNVTLRKSDGGRIAVPNGWNVTILDEAGAVLDQMGPAPGPADRCAAPSGPRRSSIALAAGQTHGVQVEVCIPVTSGSPGRQGLAPIQLTAFSQTLPGLAAGSSLGVDFEYLDRPNLRVVSVRTGTDLPVDQPRQVTVDVANDGTLAACEAEVRLTDEQHGEAPVALFAADGSVPTVGSCRRRADGVLEGGLPPGEARQFRFVWTPRTVGWHNLSAAADAAGKLSELVETDNTLSAPVLVRLPDFPDVVARVAVSDDEPNIGDAVNVSVAITNQGGISAHSVNVTMRVGVTDLLTRGFLNEGLIAKLEPGETVWINKTWRAVFPGKALVYVNALPRDGVLERAETQADNLVVLPVFVRSQGLDVTAKVVSVDVSAGEAKEAGFLISNNGDTPDAFDLTVEAPRGIRASVFLDGAKVSSIVLANRTSANLTVLFDLPARMPAGDSVVGLRAVSQNTTQTRVAPLILSVRATYGLVVDSAQVATPPGRVVVPLVVTNTGNSLDRLVVDAANAPPGWKGVASNATIEPYARSTVDLVLDVPTTSPRGLYEVVARVRDAAGIEATAVVGVQVLEYEAAVPRFAPGAASALVRPETAVERAVKLTNEGNVRAEAALAAVAPAGWTAVVDPPAVVLGPGESRDVAVRVVVPATARFGAHDVRVEAKAAVLRDAVLRVDVAESDLHVLELEHAPRVGIERGDTVTFTAVVRNDGRIDAATAGIAFYVDDTLAGYEVLDGLEAGGERTVSFRWTAVAGEHVVLAILDPGDELRESDEANNARLEVVRVGRTVGILGAAQETVPGASALAAVAAAALAAFAGGRLRRKQ